MAPIPKQVSKALAALKPPVSPCNLDQVNGNLSDSKRIISESEKSSSPSVVVTSKASSSKRVQPSKSTNAEATGTIASFFSKAPENNQQNLVEKKQPIKVLVDRGLNENQMECKKIGEDPSTQDTAVVVESGVSQNEVSERGKEVAKCHGDEESNSEIEHKSDVGNNSPPVHQKIEDRSSEQGIATAAPCTPNKEADTTTHDYVTPNGKGSKKKGSSSVKSKKKSKGKSPPPEIKGKALQFLRKVIKRADAKSFEWIFCEFNEKYPKFLKKTLKSTLNELATKKKVPGKSNRPVWVLKDALSDNNTNSKAPMLPPTKEGPTPSKVDKPPSEADNGGSSQPVQKPSKTPNTGSTVNTGSTPSSQGGSSPKSTKTGPKQTEKFVPEDKRYGEYSSLLSTLLKRAKSIGFGTPTVYEQNISCIEEPEKLNQRDSVKELIDVWIAKHKDEQFQAVPEDPEFQSVLACLVQDSELTLAELCVEVGSKLNEKLRTEDLTTAIQLLAERKGYGRKNRKVAVIAEDADEDAVWRWEVAGVDAFPTCLQKEIQQIRKDRRWLSNWISCVCRAVAFMEQPPTEALRTKIEQQIEKSLKYQRHEEVQRRKLVELQRKRKQRQLEEQERARLKKQELEEKSRLKAEREEAERIAKEKEAERKKKLSLARFFSKSTNAENENDASTERGSTAESPDLQKACLSMETKKELEKLIMEQAGSDKETLLTQFVESVTRARKKDKQPKRFRYPKSAEHFETPAVQNTTSAFGFDKVAEEQRSKDCSIAQTAKRCLYQFHENRRPAYFGTFRKLSKVIKPRIPFAQDQQLDYSIDSDEEWEETDNGESLSDDDGSEDGEAEELDYGDGWLMPDDAVIVSEDEDDMDEDENVEGVVGGLGGGRNKVKRCQMGQKGSQSFEVLVVGVQTDEKLIKSCQGPTGSDTATLPQHKNKLETVAKVLDVPISTDYRLLQYYKIQRHGGHCVKVDPVDVRNLCLHPPITATPQKRRRKSSTAENPNLVKENTPSSSNKKHKPTTSGEDKLVSNNRGKKRSLNDENAATNTPEKKPAGNKQVSPPSAQANILSFFAKRGGDVAAA